MKTRYKILFGVTAVVVIMALLYVACLFYVLTPSKMEEQTITNGQYTIKTRIYEAYDMDFLTFYVEDLDGKVVFDCEVGWRCWDFKEIKFLDGSNDVYVDSSDVGTTIYRFSLNENGEPVWIAEDNYEEIE